MTLALLTFMAVAGGLAAYLFVSSMRTSREEQRELERAREREEAARRAAETARATRARWEAKIAEEQLEAALGDPRGIGDGLGRDEVPRVRTGRFRRQDVPAPFSGQHR